MGVRNTYLTQYTNYPRKLECQPKATCDSDSNQHRYISNQHRHIGRWADRLRSVSGSDVDTQTGIRGPIPQSEALCETTLPSNTGNHTHRSILKGRTLGAVDRPHSKNAAGPGNTLIFQRNLFGSLRRHVGRGCVMIPLNSRRRRRLLSPIFLRASSLSPMVINSMNSSCSNRP